jgi:photosystem II stability/assembly factor-like uncharacterized protein
VDFVDPDRQTLVAGGHEQNQTVNLSIDGGKTWSNVGGGIPAAAGFTSYPLVINAQTFLVSSAAGIFRSRDAGLSWQRVSAAGPTAAPLRASNGVIYWAAGARLLRSADAGLTWAAVGDGLQGRRPVELADGQLVAVGQSSLVLSSDSGVNWSPLGAALPYVPDGLTYSPQRKAFYIWHGGCQDRVAPDAIMQFEFDAPPPSRTAPPAGKKR